MTEATSDLASNGPKQLVAFLDELCQPEQDNDFIIKLAQSRTRWASVSDLLLVPQKEALDQIGFRPLQKGDGFSPGNLKAHYVLDEEFINNGSAIILFSLVGAQWTHVVHVEDQNRITSPALWLEGED